MKKIFSLAIFSLFAAAGMAQSAKAQLKMDEGKFAEALQIVQEAIVDNDAAVKEATEKAQAKGKPVVLDKQHQKYAALYNQGATCYAQIFNPELMKAANQQPLDTMLFVQSLDNMIDFLCDKINYLKLSKTKELLLWLIPRPCLPEYAKASQSLSTAAGSSPLTRAER